MSAAWIGAFISLATLVLLLTLLVVGLMRRISSVLERAEQVLVRSDTFDLKEGLQPGDFVAAGDAVTSTGRPWSTSEVRDDAHVIVFVDPGCPPCDNLIDELMTGPQLPRAVNLVLVSPDIDMRLASLSRRYTVLRDTNHALSRAFGTSVSPNAFAIDAGGVVAAQEIPTSMEALNRLGQRLRGGGWGIVTDALSGTPE